MFTIAQLAERYETESDIVGRTPAYGLPAYAFPGGYPMGYTDEYNNMLCADCASEEIRQKRADPNMELTIWTDIISWYVFEYSEGDVYCDDCNALIYQADDDW